MAQTGFNPVDFVLKVYDTLALAEAGLETTALKVVTKLYHATIKEIINSRINR